MSILPAQVTWGKSQPIEVGAKVVGSRFKAGERFRLPDNDVFKVVREVNAGEDRRVYLVERKKDGRRFVFKHARTKEIPKGRAGIEKEIRTVNDLAEMQVRHPDIVASGKDWVLRDWVEGDLGLVWFKQWKARGYDSQDPMWLKFYAILARTAAKGRAVGAMDLDDIIDEGGEWSVVDSGRVRKLSVREAWDFYLDDLRYSWGDKLGNPDVCEVLVRLVVPPKS